MPDVFFRWPRATGSAKASGIWAAVADWFDLGGLLTRAVGKFGTLRVWEIRIALRVLGHVARASVSACVQLGTYRRVVSLSRPIASLCGCAGTMSERRAFVQMAVARRAARRAAGGAAGRAC